MSWESSTQSKQLSVRGAMAGLGAGLVGRGLVEAPGGIVAGRPAAALLFWFFGDFGCCVSLFIVIRVIYKYRNR